MEEFTRKFNVAQEKDAEIRHILTTVYAALEDKGYNPINQIVGYILSEDPTYITNHNNARTLIRKLDRDELLQTLVRSYLGKYARNVRITTLGDRERGLRGFVAFFRPTFIDKGSKKCYTAKSYKTVTKLQIGYKDRSESDGRSYGRSRLPRTPAAPCG